jgi:hypothetical protein
MAPNKSWTTIHGALDERRFRPCHFSQQVAFTSKRFMPGAMAWRSIRRHSALPRQADAHCQADGGLPMVAGHPSYQNRSSPEIDVPLDRDPARAILHGVRTR